MNRQLREPLAVIQKSNYMTIDVASVSSHRKTLSNAKPKNNNQKLVPDEDPICRSSNKKKR